MQMGCILIAGLLIYFSSNKRTYAQSESINPNEEIKKRDNSFSVGLNLNNRGWGIEGIYTTRYNFRYKAVFTTTFTNFKEANEVRIESFYKDQGGKDLIFRKQNYCYLLATMAGVQRTFQELDFYNRLEISGTVSAGPVFAFLKPYYIEYAVPIPGTSNQAEVKSAPYNPNDTLHAYTNLVGEGDFYNGFASTRVSVGLRTRAQLNMNLTASSWYLRTVTIGLQADILTSRLQIMSNVQPKFLLLTGFIGFLFGKAW